jgi:hypothetical protein
VISGEIWGVRAKPAILTIWAMYSISEPRFFDLFLVQAQRRSVRSNQSRRKIMRMTCNFPRMQALRIGLVLLAASLSVPLSAQTARIHSNGAQANLRIEVKVVPAVGVHHRDKDDKDKGKDKDGRREEDAVSYHLNPPHEEFLVSEEMRPMLVDFGNTVQQEQVRAITIVPK